MSMLELSQWKFSNEPSFRLISVTGEDAETFLQGQLTQNVKALKEDKAAWTASCNHQGRVASSALLTRIPNGFALMVPASIAEEEVDRLSKFILRSKVEIAIDALPITYFCTTDAAAAKIPCPGLPKDEMSVYRGNSVMVVRLPSKGADGFYAKFVAFGTIPEGMSAKTNEQDLLADALMEEGVALIEKSETLEWLPQALNMDLIGAISFDKGCYTGQEVVSKTQHLGKIKRRLFLGQCKDLDNVDAGTEVFMENEPMGRVIQSLGNRFLYVLRFDYMDSELTVKGKTLEKIDLPYNVTVPASVI